MTFAFAHRTQLWLEIPPTAQTESWQPSHSYSTPESRWRAYLNQICLNSFLPWLQEEYYPEARVWPNPAALPSLWEMVNGTAITMGVTRLVLIPTPPEAIDGDELRVPQEWLDIPSLAADYYLAAQVNPEERWVQIWGYTTHKQLKNSGSYDPVDRTYSLDGDDLTHDLNVLWLTQELCPEEATREIVTPLPTLSEVQAENLVQRLGNPEVAFPRLAVPFTLWGALLEEKDWRQSLYQQRQGEGVPGKVPVNLSQWLNNLFETGWQSLEALFPESDNLTFSFRRTSSLRETQVRRVKLIDLGTQLEGQGVMLMIGLTAEADERISVRVQLHPANANSYLPVKIILALLSESGTILKSVEAGSEDNYIQLQRFKCSPGLSFSLRITLDDFSFTEHFTVSAENRE